MELHMVAIAAVAAIGVLPVVLRATKGLRGELMVALGLRVLGLEAVRDVYLPDGRGGLTQVDHLVKLPVGIAVIETKNYSGRIFGREREARWTQVLGRRKFPFQNPLRQNFLHAEAVRAIVPPGVEVLPHVLFVGNATFRQMPDGVSGPWTFFWHLRKARGTETPPDVEAAWRGLMAVARRDRAARREHRRQLRARGNAWSD